MAYLAFNQMKRQKLVYDGYLLTIENDFISVQNLEKPTVTLNKNEITAISTDKSGNLFIGSIEAKQVIFISKHIQSFDKVKQELNDILPITSIQYKSLLAKYPYLFAIIMVILFGVVYLSNNKILVAIAGFPLIAYMVYSFIKIQTSPLFDKKLKKNSIWFIVVILSITAIVFFKVFNLFS